MKYRLQCFDVSGCQAPFARSELKEVLGSSIMEKLDSLQQEDEIRNAELEGLEDCPFCSYKVVLPPVEEDKEFRCENTSCRVVSCRLCKEKSHIPMSCEENKNDKGLSERHQVEEAMSQALIRKCPKCQVQIVKEYGCNKMQCTKCGTMMCYSCQKDITRESYNHFDRGCNQTDFDREFDYQQVKKAERAAIDRILEANPDLTEEQIRVGHQKTRNAEPHGPAGDLRQHRGFAIHQARVRAARARSLIAEHVQRQQGVYPPPTQPLAQQPAHPQPTAQTAVYPQDDGFFQMPGQPIQGLGAAYPGHQPGNLAFQPATVGLPNAPQQLHNYNYFTGFPEQNYDVPQTFDANAGFQLDMGQFPQPGAMQGQDYQNMFNPFFGPF